MCVLCVCMCVCVCVCMCMYVCVCMCVCVYVCRRVEELFADDKATFNFITQWIV